MTPEQQVWLSVYTTALSSMSETGDDVTAHNTHEVCEAAASAAVARFLKIWPSGSVQAPKSIGSGAPLLTKKKAD